EATPAPLPPQLPPQTAPVAPPEPDPRDARIAELEESQRDHDRNMNRLASKLEETRAQLEASKPPPTPIDQEVGKGGEDVVPPELAEFREGDETAKATKERLYQKLRKLLFRFGINEGDHFVGGGEPLTPDEKIAMFALIAANFKAKDWLDVQPFLPGVGDAPK